jgi:small subunit ribosomal protein S19
MTRSLYKGPFIDPIVHSQLGEEVMLVFMRSTTILPVFVGKIIMVHNGLDFYPVQINEKMVGKKVGEFVGTKKKVIFRKKKRKK